MAAPKYPAHPLIEQLTREPGEGASRFLGYFGGTTDGVVSIYPSLEDLSVYYDIREDDIVSVEDASPDELPNGGSVILVKASAQVQHCVNRRTSVEARYLTGDISARMTSAPAPTSQGFLARLAGPKPEFSIWPCSVVWGACMPTSSPCVQTQGCIKVETFDPTCAGYTCNYQCHSVMCPPTDHCSVGPFTVCQVFSRDVC